ncbi:MAG TPA: MXAN_2562 family outer membrane beta-barrel protein, partial [Polyangiaceae bacterium]
VLRVDVLRRELRVPFVPYAKLGLGYSIWRASNTVGTSNYAGNVGVGGSLGTELGVGLAFNLNVFDEYAAKNFDEAVGVNNTYAFAEYTRDDLDGLGIQSNPLRVGGEAWTFGIAVEF